MSYCFASVKQYGRLREELYHIENLIPSSMCEGLNCLLRQKYHLRYLFYCVLWLFAYFLVILVHFRFGKVRLWFSHVLLFIYCKTTWKLPYYLLNTFLFGFSMFSTLSRVEKAVGLCFTDGVQEPRCEVTKLFVLFSFNYKLFKFTSVSHM